MRIESRPIRSLSGNDHDDTHAGDSTKLIERGAQMLYMLESVRRDDGVERRVAKRKFLDVSVHPSDVSVMTTTARAHRYVAADYLVLVGE
jgi:hypothetical protein